VKRFRGLEKSHGGTETSDPRGLGALAGLAKSNPPARAVIPAQNPAAGGLGPRSPRTASPVLPYAALFFGVVALGSTAIFVRLADAPGSVFAFYRMAIAVSITALPFGIQANRTRPFPHPPLWVAMLGGLFLSLDLWIWNDAVHLTSAANATLFGNTSVIWVAIGSMVLLKERLRSAFWIGLVLAVLGMLVIMGQDMSHPTLGVGDLMCILAGFFYGLFFLATARARERLNSFVAWWMSSLASALFLLAISLVLQKPLVGYTMQTYLCILGAAFLTQLGGYLSVNYAIGRLPVSTVSPTLLAQPVVTAILAVPLLGQPITLAQILGGALILFGIFVINKASERKPARSG
jgi:drug/metabolite transporter (DMT)-like permease